MAQILQFPDRTLDENGRWFEVEDLDELGIFVLKLRQVLLEVRKDTPCL